MAVEAQLRRAAGHLQRGELEEAERACQAVIRAAPRQPDANHFLGLIALRRGRSADAAGYLAIAFAVRPKHASIALNLGYARSMMGDAAGAIEAYRSVVTADPASRRGWSNLGRALMQLDRSAEAVAAFREAAALESQSPDIRAELGAALLATEDYVGAEAELRAALALAPGYPKAIQDLCMALAAQGRADEALAVVDRAIAGGARGLARARALALHRVGRKDAAISQLQTSVDNAPTDTDAHELLKRFIWLNKGSAKACIAPLERAAKAYPGSVALQLKYAESLAQIDDAQGALAILESALERHPDELAVQHAYGGILLALHQAERALPVLERAAAASGHVRPRLTLARALLANGDPERAIAELAELRALKPLDQEILAYMATASRQIGGEASAALNDTELLVENCPIPVPRGFADAHAFNAALAERLATWHDSAEHPLEQTLRGGTQTEGDIFRRNDPLLACLKESLEHTVQRFIETLPCDPSHPTLGRITEQFRLKGGWSVRLRPGGYHTDHIHPDGWLSSAYYVALPAGVGDPGNEEGCLRLGVPDRELGLDLPPLRTIAPAIGHLVLFPSYLWHGTTPFSGAAPRLTVAFDVVPG